jgi:hypothetical protein
LVSGSYLRIIEAGILAPGVNSTFFYIKEKQSDKSSTVSQLKIQGKKETDLCGSCISSQHADIQRFVTIEHEVDLTQGLSHTASTATIFALVLMSELDELLISGAGNVGG